MATFQNIFSKEIALIDGSLKTYLGDMKKQAKDWGYQNILKSVEYSLLSSGKRFRPVLALITAEVLGEEVLNVLPWASAVEMIHCYSLIHDDLPMMDDDDIRRGQASNHKVFGEAQALLAGDGLLTEGFELISSAYARKPKVGLALVGLLSEAAGFRGMVSGQAMDMEARNKLLDGEDIKLLHSKKTGALIRVAVEGAALVAQTELECQKAWREFGEALGLAFQLSDDLLDFDRSNPEPSSFPGLLGRDEAWTLLQDTSEEALSVLDDIWQTWGKTSSHSFGNLTVDPSGAQSRLVELVKFNQVRALRD